MIASLLFPLETAGVTHLDSDGDTLVLYSENWVHGATLPQCSSALVVLHTKLRAGCQFKSSVTAHRNLMNDTEQVFGTISGSIGNPPPGLRFGAMCRVTTSKELPSTSKNSQNPPLAPNKSMMQVRLLSLLRPGSESLDTVAITFELLLAATPDPGGGGGSADAAPPPYQAPQDSPWLPSRTGGGSSDGRAGGSGGRRDGWARAGAAAAARCLVSVGVLRLENDQECVLRRRRREEEGQVEELVDVDVDEGSLFSGQRNDRRGGSRFAGGGGGGDGGWGGGRTGGSWGQEGRERSGKAARSNIVLCAKELSAEWCWHGAFFFSG